MSKSEVRVKIKEKLNSELEYINRNHDKVSDNLKTLIQNLISEKFNGQKILIGTYSPILNEPVWFKSFTGSECEFSLVHMHDEIRLSFHKINFMKLKELKGQLRLGSQQIEAEVIPDVLLIPGIAFSKNFDRLGRGRAYFDNYLKDYRGLRVGVFFDLQQVENTYSEGHDEKLDYIVTEKNILIRGI